MCKTVLTLALALFPAYAQAHRKNEIGLLGRHGHPRA